MYIIDLILRGLSSGLVHQVGIYKHARNNDGAKPELIKLNRKQTPSNIQDRLKGRTVGTVGGIATVWRGHKF
jgi:hypothetical protein